MEEAQPTSESMQWDFGCTDEKQSSVLTEVGVSVTQLSKKRSKAASSAPLPTKVPAISGGNAGSNEDQQPDTDYFPERRYLVEANIPPYNAQRLEIVRSVLPRMKDYLDVETVAVLGSLSFISTRATQALIKLCVVLAVVRCHVQRVREYMKDTVDDEVAAAAAASSRRTATAMLGRFGYAPVSISGVASRKNNSASDYYKTHAQQEVSASSRSTGSSTHADSTQNSSVDTDIDTDVNTNANSDTDHDDDDTDDSDGSSASDSADY